MPQNVSDYWAECEKLDKMPVKTVWQYFDINVIVICRTDVQPLMWIWWWIYFRLIESIRLFNRFILILLQTWGLYNRPPEEFPLWSQFWKQMFNKAVKAIKLVRPWLVISQIFFNFAFR